MKIHTTKITCFTWFTCFQYNITGRSTLLELSTLGPRTSAGYNQQKKQETYKSSSTRPENRLFYFKIKVNDVSSLHILHECKICIRQTIFSAFKMG